MNDRQPICTWSRDSFDYDAYLSECGSAFMFNDGGPRQNNFRFCPYCGKPVEESDELREEKGND